MFVAINDVAFSLSVFGKSYPICVATFFYFGHF
jgi:hypothetical protein